MPRGRRAATTADKTVVASTKPVEETKMVEEPAVPADETVPDEAEADAEAPTGEDVDVEPSADEVAEEEAFAAAAVAPEVATPDEDDDPYGFNDEKDEEDAENSQELATEVVADLVKITYNGLRSEGRAPGTISLIVPDEPIAHDSTAIIRSGTDYRLTLGVPAYVTEEHADWLSSHPTFDIQKA